MTSDQLSGQSGVQLSSARQDLGVWAARRTLAHELPAWLISFSLHLVLILLLALFVRVTYQGASIEGDRGGGIVLAMNVDGEAKYFGEDQENSSSRQVESRQQEARTALPATQHPPADFAGMLPSAAGETGADSNVASLPSASDFAGDLHASGGQVGGNQVRTGVFGVEGTGTKFVYVFDRSASMASYEGRPLAAAKSELIASLRDLSDIHQFQIIFYNDRPMVFNPNRPRPPRMLYGNDAMKRLGANFVRAIVAAGGTRHMEALQLALSMQPEVIFFLTDADEPALTPSQLDEIRSRNARVGATINAIEFGVGPQKIRMNFLMRLAQQNGGQYAYVDVTRLPSTR